MIAHRGNTCGPNPDRENTAEYIQEAIDKGYHVEIDLRVAEDDLFLGHDDPDRRVELRWLVERADKLLIHAKNREALQLCLAHSLHCFAHQKDDFTMTSEGYVWVHDPRDEITADSIVPLITRYEVFEYERLDEVRGLCTDWPDLVPRYHREDSEGFGGSGITKELFDFVYALLPKGSHILELGSGPISTPKFVQAGFRVTTVENDEKYLGYESGATYIHAPMRESWYCRDAVRNGLRDLPPYDLLLVDGPVGSESRRMFYGNRDLFDLNCHIILDDTWRPNEYQVAVLLQEELKRATVHCGQHTIMLNQPSSKGIIHAF